MLNSIKKKLRKYKIFRLLIYKIKSEYLIFKKFNFLNKKSIFLDIGANIGLVSEVINDIYGCKIYCYEPHPGAFKILENKFSKFNNIYLINMAVSNINKSSNLFLHKNSDINKLNDVTLSEASSLDENKSNIDFKKSILVQTIDIKNVIDMFDYIDCVKIDIEGHEYEILPYIFQNKNKIGKVFCEFHGSLSKKNANLHLKKSYDQTKNYIKKNNLENWIIDWI